MGLVLDSSVLLAAERQELPVSTLLDMLQERLGHGVYRAQSPQRPPEAGAIVTRSLWPSPPNRLRA